MNHAGRRPTCAGYIAIALLSLLAMAGLVAIAAQWSATRLRLRQAEATTQALAQAKDALIAYAAAHTSVPGVLPCPDIYNTASLEGSPKIYGGKCAAYIGRLPWKKLGLADLRDGAGECLWYALSPRFQDAGSHAVANGSAINSSTPGTLDLRDAFGNTATGSPVIAIVFAPGAALPGQERSNSASHPICGGNDQATNYLDIASTGINNATGNGVYRFAAAAPGDTFNDRLISISTAELFAGVDKRIVGEIRASLKHYYETAGQLPYAASDANIGSQTAGLGSGAIPWYDLQPPPFIDALTSNRKNGWYSLITYRRNSAASATLTLNGRAHELSLH